jgi:tripartite-type tricarboxylate transporter receptor subunit TctC
MPVRIFGAAVTVSALLLSAATAFAQTYPNKSVRVVVGFAAGGPSDVIARIVSQKLTETLGHQFYVENIGGAGGNTAAGQVARAPADGYTIHIISTGFMVNPEPLRQGAVRSDQGFRAGDLWLPRHRTSWWSIPRCRRRRFPNW